LLGLVGLLGLLGFIGLQNKAITGYRLWVASCGLKEQGKRNKDLKNTWNIGIMEWWKNGKKDQGSMNKPKLFQPVIL
jgi:hypothetical protein